MLWVFRSSIAKNIIDYDLCNSIDLYNKGKKISKKLKDTSFVDELYFIDNKDEVKDMKNCHNDFSSVLNNAKSYIDNETKIEGVVVKYLSDFPLPITEVKYVSDEFLEKKNKKQYKGFDIIYNYLTPARIDKFLRRINIEPTSENLKDIIDQIDILVNDIWVEEKLEINKMIREQFDIRAKQKVKKYVKKINKKEKE